MADQTVVIIDDQVKRTKLKEPGARYKVEEIEHTKPENAKDLSGSDGPVTVKGWLNPENNDVSFHIKILNKSVGTIKDNIRNSINIEVDFQKDKGSVRFQFTGGDQIPVIYELYNETDRTHAEGHFVLK